MSGLNQGSALRRVPLSKDCVALISTTVSSNFKYKMLQSYFEDNFCGEVAKSMAIQCLRKVTSVEKKHREIPAFVATTRSYIIYLHDYNMKVHKVSSVYPYTEEFSNLILHYVLLECRILYKRLYFSKDKELQVEDRILRLLLNIYNDYFSSKMSRGREALMKSSMAIFDIFKKLRFNIPGANYRLLENMTIVLLKKIGLYEKVKAYKENQIPGKHDDPYLKIFSTDVFKKDETPDTLNDSLELFSENQNQDPNSRTEPRERTLSDILKDCTNDEDIIEVEEDTTQIKNDPDKPYNENRNTTVPKRKMVRTILLDDSDDDVELMDEEVESVRLKNKPPERTSANNSKTNANHVNKFKTSCLPTSSKKKESFQPTTFGLSEIDEFLDGGKSIDIDSDSESDTKEDFDFKIIEENTKVESNIAKLETKKKILHSSNKTDARESSLDLETNLESVVNKPIKDNHINEVIVNTETIVIDDDANIIEDKESTSVIGSNFESNENKEIENTASVSVENQLNNKSDVFVINKEIQSEVDNLPTPLVVKADGINMEVLNLQRKQDNTNLCDSSPKTSFDNICVNEENFETFGKDTHINEVIVDTERIVIDEDANIIEDKESTLDIGSNFESNENKEIENTASVSVDNQLNNKSDVFVINKEIQSEVDNLPTPLVVKADGINMEVLNLERKQDNTNLCDSPPKTSFDNICVNEENFETFGKDTHINEVIVDTETIVIDEDANIIEDKESTLVLGSNFESNENKEIENTASVSVDNQLNNKSDVFVINKEIQSEVDNLPTPLVVKADGINMEVLKLERKQDNTNLCDSPPKTSFDNICGVNEENFTTFEKDAHINEVIIDTETIVIHEDANIIEDKESTLVIDSNFQSNDKEIENTPSVSVDNQLNNNSKVNSLPTSLVEKAGGINMEVLNLERKQDDTNLCYSPPKTSFDNICVVNEENFATFGKDTHINEVIVDTETIVIDEDANIIEDKESTLVIGSNFESNENKEIENTASVSVDNQLNNNSEVNNLPTPLVKKADGINMEVLNLERKQDDTNLCDSPKTSFDNICVVNEENFATFGKDTHINEVIVDTETIVIDEDANIIEDKESTLVIGSNFESNENKEIENTASVSVDNQLNNNSEVNNLPTPLVEKADGINLEVLNLERKQDDTNLCDSPPKTSFDNICVVNEENFATFGKDTHINEVIVDTETILIDEDANKIEDKESTLVIGSNFESNENKEIENTASVSVDNQLNNKSEVNNLPTTLVEKADGINIEVLNLKRKQDDTNLCDSPPKTSFDNICGVNEENFTTFEKDTHINEVIVNTETIVIDEDANIIEDKESTLVIESNFQSNENKEIENTASVSVDNQLNNNSDVNNLPTPLVEKADGINMEVLNLERKQDDTNLCDSPPKTSFDNICGVNEENFTTFEKDTHINEVIVDTETIVIDDDANIIEDKESTLVIGSNFESNENKEIENTASVSVDNQLNNKSDVFVINKEIQSKVDNILTPKTIFSNMCVVNEQNFAAFGKNIENSDGLLQLAYAAELKSNEGNLRLKPKHETLNKNMAPKKPRTKAEKKSFDQDLEKLKKKRGKPEYPWPKKYDKSIINSSQNTNKKVKEKIDSPINIVESKPHRSSVQKKKNILPETLSNHNVPLDFSKCKNTVADTVRKLIAKNNILPKKASTSNPEPINIKDSLSEDLEDVPLNLRMEHDKPIDLRKKSKSEAPKKEIKIISNMLLNKKMLEKEKLQPFIKNLDKNIKANIKKPLSPKPKKDTSMKKKTTNLTQSGPDRKLNSDKRKIDAKINETSSNLIKKGINDKFKESPFSDENTQINLQKLEGVKEIDSKNAEIEKSKKEKIIRKLPEQRPTKVHKLELSESPDFNNQVGVKEKKQIQIFEINSNFGQESNIESSQNSSNSVFENKDLSPASANKKEKSTVTETILMDTFENSTFEELKEVQVKNNKTDLTLSKSELDSEIHLPDLNVIQPVEDKPSENNALIPLNEYIYNSQVEGSCKEDNTQYSEIKETLETVSPGVVEIHIEDNDQTMENVPTSETDLWKLINDRISVPQSEQEISKKETYQNLENQLTSENNICNSLKEICSISQSEEENLGLKSINEYTTYSHELTCENNICISLNKSNSGSQSEKESSKEDINPSIESKLISTNDVMESINECTSDAQNTKEDIIQNIDNELTSENGICISLNENISSFQNKEENPKEENSLFIEKNYVLQSLNDLQGEKEISKGDNDQCLKSKQTLGISELKSLIECDSVSQVKEAKGYNEALDNNLLLENDIWKSLSESTFVSEHKEEDPKEKNKQPTEQTSENDELKSLNEYSTVSQSKENEEDTNEATKNKSITDIDVWKSLKEFITTPKNKEETDNVDNAAIMEKLDDAIKDLSKNKKIKCDETVQSKNEVPNSDIISTDKSYMNTSIDSKASEETDLNISGMSDFCEFIKAFNDSKSSETYYVEVSEIFDELTEPPSEANDVTLPEITASNENTDANILEGANVELEVVDFSEVTVPATSETNEIDLTNNMVFNEVTVTNDEEFSETFSKVTDSRTLKTNKAENCKNTENGSIEIATFDEFANSTETNDVSLSEITVSSEVTITTTPEINDSEEFSETFNENAGSRGLKTNKEEVYKTAGKGDLDISRLGDLNYSSPCETNKVMRPAPVVPQTRFKTKPDMPDLNFDCEETTTPNKSMNLGKIISKPPTKRLKGKISSGINPVTDSTVNVVKTTEVPIPEITDTQKNHLYISETSHCNNVTDPIISELFDFDGLVTYSTVAPTSEVDNTETQQEINDNKNNLFINLVIDPNNQYSEHCYSQAIQKGGESSGYSRDPVMSMGFSDSIIPTDILDQNLVKKEIQSSNEELLKDTDNCVGNSENTNNVSLHTKTLDKNDDTFYPEPWEIEVPNLANVNDSSDYICKIMIKSELSSLLEILTSHKKVIENPENTLDEMETKKTITDMKINSMGDTKKSSQNVLEQTQSPEMKYNFEASHSKEKDNRRSPRIHGKKTETNTEKSLHKHTISSNETEKKETKPEKTLVTDTEYISKSSTKTPSASLKRVYEPVSKHTKKKSEVTPPEEIHTESFNTTVSTKTYKHNTHSNKRPNSDSSDSPRKRKHKTSTDKTFDELYRQKNINPHFKPNTTSSRKSEKKEEKESAISHLSKYPESPIISQSSHHYSSNNSNNPRKRNLIETPKSSHFKQENTNRSYAYNQVSMDSKDESSSYSKKKIKWEDTKDYPEISKKHSTNVKEDHRRGSVGEGATTRSYYHNSSVSQSQRKSYPSSSHKDYSSERYSEGKRKNNKHEYGHEGAPSHKEDNSYRDSKNVQGSSSSSYFSSKSPPPHGSNRQTSSDSSTSQKQSSPRDWYQTVGKILSERVGPLGSLKRN